MSARDLGSLVFLALGDHWTCALLRAELLERGHDAACVPGIASALVASVPASLARASVLVAEDATLSTQDRWALAWLRAIDPSCRVVLLTSASAEVEKGPWDRVLRRPIRIGEITDVVDGLVRGTPEPNLARARSADRAPRQGFQLRVGPPWPMVGCRQCSASRHCETPQTPAEEGLVIQALVTFGLEHQRCNANRCV